ncbi:MAG: hypothetical protein H0X12_04070 [Nocardioides sp.]|nr:hypothetical protein [Nocardioides sp.]
MKEYILDIGGVEHTVQLSDEDAKTRGLKPVEEKAAPAPKNKARETTAKKG